MTGHYFILASIAVLAGVCAGFLSWLLRLHKQVQQSGQLAGLEKHNLRHEFFLRLQPLEKAQYERESGKERIVYDGRKAIKTDDFTGGGERAWDYAAHRFADGRGEGSHEISGNVITINRSNTAGRYELFLKRFAFNETDYDRIPASSAQKQRRLRLTCEVKKESASHLLRFVFKGERTKEVLDEKDVAVFNPDWQGVEVFFTIATNEDCVFRIDDLEVLEAPSEIQIRNIVLWEKQSEG